MPGLKLVYQRLLRRPAPAGSARTFALLVSAWCAVVFSTVGTSTQQPAAPPVPADAPDGNAVVKRSCVACHNERLRTGGLALDKLDASNPGADPAIWEKVVGKLRQASMPPPGRPRPDAATYEALAASLELRLDRAWEANPNPGPDRRRSTA